MENATIGYKGMSSVPSDYLCEDGDMKLAVDAEVRDGSYHATRVPKEECFHVDGFYPKFYHEPSDGKKYFIGLRHDEEDKWVLAAYDKDGVKVEIENAPEGNEESAFGNFCAMGNLVCLTVKYKVDTLIYKGEKYIFISLAKKPLDIRFGAKLSNHSDLSDGSYAHFDSVYNVGNKKDYKPALGDKNNEYYVPTHFDDENLKADEAMFSSFNTEVNMLLSKNNFVFPILLKYAIRLYNGEYINVSPPILIFPYPDAVRARTEMANADSGNFGYRLDPYSIYYSLPDETIKTIEELGKSNIFYSLDFFITPQIYTIRTDHIVRVFLNEIQGYDYRFIKTKNYEELYKQTSFYLVKSLVFEDFNNQFNFDNGVFYKELLSSDDTVTLAELVQQKTLDESTYSNSDIYASYLSVYNSRLNACNISKSMPEIWPIPSLCPCILCKYDNEIGDGLCDDFVNNGTYSYYNRDNTYPTFCGIHRIIVDIDSEIYRTYSESNDNNGKYIPLYYEYPINGSGYIYVNDVDSVKIKLMKSIYNSSAYYFAKNKKELKSLFIKTDTIQNGSVGVFMYKNLIKASDVNSPFTFKDGNSCECGKGGVIAVASMSAPTSQGQFGQYPLFAFCTDGIYAIGIGSDGTIQNCSPYSTDILAGEEALANVGRDIVFASKAGVMSIGEEGRSLLLPAIKEELYGYDNERQKTFVSKVLTDMGVPLPDTTNVYTYITNGVRMAYDYQHGRVILYNPNYGYSYVLDAQSKSWSIMTKQFKDHLNPVAECLMVAPDGQTLHDYSTDEVVDEHGAFLVTRPFKMEAANVMKTIHSLIQRGNLRSKDAVQQALYGSRDLVNWVPIWSSKDIYLRGFRGTGYKYFRLLVFLPEMTQNDGIDGATISYLPRETDQQR